MEPHTDDPAWIGIHRFQLPSRRVGHALAFRWNVTCEQEDKSAEGIHLTPLRRAYRRSAQNTGARPSYGAQMLGVPVIALIVVVVFVLLASVAAPPAPDTSPSNPLPVKQLQASPSSKQTTPSPSASPSSSPSASPSPSPSASASPT